MTVDPDRDRIITRRARRAITHTDGYRFWVEVCEHGLPRDDPTFYDYPCCCCGHAIGPHGLTNGKCEGCVA